MINKHEVEKIKYLKLLHAKTLETEHTHTLYVYQISKKEKENIIKNRRKNL